MWQETGGGTCGNRMIGLLTILEVAPCNLVMQVMPQQLWPASSASPTTLKLASAKNNQLGWLS